MLYGASAGKGKIWLLQHTLLAECTAKQSDMQGNFKA